MAGGVFSVESPVQKRQGTQLTIDECYTFHMDMTNWESDGRLVRKWMNTTGKVIGWLEDYTGVEFVEPLGAQYCFFRVDGLFDDELTGAGAFCERLLAGYGVATLPGEAFGDGRWVRLTYGVPERVLGDALERIAAFMETLVEREAE